MSIFRRTSRARPGRGFPSERTSGKLRSMSILSQVPALPADWPFLPREAGDPPHRCQEASLGVLGGGWTLHVRGPALPEGKGGALPQAFGRGGIQRAGDVVLRPYRRGGLVRHVNARIYASPARFEREFAAHLALWNAGFPTVEPLGWGWRRRAWGVEGVFLTRFEDARAWPLCWERSAEVLPPLAVMLRALAAWGLHAPDLNATNVLLAADGRVLALDWDRAAWKPGGDLLARYRERLARSLLKLRAPDEVRAALTRSLAG